MPNWAIIFDICGLPLTPHTHKVESKVNCLKGKTWERVHDCGSGGRAECCSKWLGAKLTSGRERTKLQYENSLCVLLSHLGDSLHLTNPEAVCMAKSSWPGELLSWLAQVRWGGDSVSSISFSQDQTADVLWDNNLRKEESFLQRASSKKPSVDSTQSLLYTDTNYQHWKMQYCKWWNNWENTGDNKNKQHCEWVTIGLSKEDGVSTTQGIQPN